MKSLSVIIAKLLLVSCLVALLAGCALEDRARRQSLKDVYVRENSDRYSSAFRESGWEGGWSSVERIRVYYSEPFLDNYELFEKNWGDYRGDFGAWFGKHFEQTFRSRLKETSRTAAWDIRVEMKADEFWKLESREMEQVKPYSSPRVLVDRVPLPRDRADAGTDGLEIHITPVNVHAVNQDSLSMVTYRCRVVVLDSKTGNVILYENVEASGSFFGDRRQAYRPQGALVNLVEELISGI